MLRRPTAAANKGGKPRTCRTSAGALTVSPSRNIDEGFGVYPVLVVSVSPPRAQVLLYMVSVLVTFYFKLPVADGWFRLWPACGGVRGGWGGTRPRGPHSVWPRSVGGHRP